MSFLNCLQASPTPWLTIFVGIPEVYVNPQWKRFSWYAKSYPQYYAIGFVLQQLYQGDIADASLRERAQKAVEETFASLEEDEQTGPVQKRGAIWAALSLLRDKTVNERRLHKPAPAPAYPPLTSASVPMPTPPESLAEGPFSSEFDFNALGNPLFDLVDFDEQGDLAAFADFL